MSGGNPVLSKQRVNQLVTDLRRYEGKDLSGIEALAKKSDADKNKLVSDIQALKAMVAVLEQARGDIVHDHTRRRSAEQLADLTTKQNKILAELRDKEQKLIHNIQTTKTNIAQTAEEVARKQQQLLNNEQTFDKYSDEIRKKMAVVATRDRMLQLSQERNVYKKKMIYVLFTIIITLIVAIVGVYVFLSRRKA